MLYMKIAKHISAHMGRQRYCPRETMDTKNYTVCTAYVRVHRTAHHCRVPCLGRHTLKLHANKGPAHCHGITDPPCHEVGRKTALTAAKQGDFPCLRGIPL